MILDAFHDDCPCLRALRQREDPQKRPRWQWDATSQVPGVRAHVYFGAQRAALRRGFSGAGDQGLPGQDQYRRHQAHLWGLLPDHPGLGGGKKWRACRRWRTRSCPARKATCWSWTNFGALWAASSTPAGCGWLFAEEPARSSPTPSETAARRAPWNCARPSPRTTLAGPPAVTSGKPTQRPSRPVPIAAVARNKGRPTTSSVGLAPCEPAPAAWCAGPTPSQKSGERHAEAIHLFITGYNLQIQRQATTS